MRLYQINDLERLTGIKAHTLRIWEKRYDLIVPHRTATNIRYYDDEQVRKLLNVATLLNQGLKISHIAELGDLELKKKIVEQQALQNQNTPEVGYINDLIAATIKFDEDFFEKILASAIVRLGLSQTIFKVVYVFLERVGLLWSVDEIGSAEEHFASQIVRRKLIAAIDGLPPTTKKNKKFLLFLPPNEWHEIALLFSDYIIRQKGYKTFYLGQNIQYETIPHIIESINPTHIVTFFIARKEPTQMDEFLKMFAVFKNIKIMVSSSNAFTKQPLPNNIISIYNADDLLKQL